MTGRIEIRDLRATGVHGVLEEERRDPQPFSVDLDVWLDVSAAARSDSLTDTADYGALIELAARAVAETSFQLLEALAAAVADAVLAADSRVERVAVTVRKLHPPVPADVGSIGVHVVRDRRE